MIWKGELVEEEEVKEGREGGSDSCHTVTNASPL